MQDPTPISISSYDDYRLFLQDLFSSRKAKNPRYSLRSFAKSLEMAPSTISVLLKHRQELTIQSGTLMSRKLGFSVLERQLFLDLIRLRKSLDLADAAHIRARIGKAKLEIEAKTVQDEWLFIIKEWYHIALIELTRLEDFCQRDEWIAPRLGINLLEVAPAIARLKKIGMLEERNGRLQASNNFMTTSHGVPSKVIRSLHRQILSLAQRSLQKHSVSVRDNSFIVFATSKEKVASCRDRLQAFRREMMQEMENCPQKDTVYCLSLNLFPVDQ